VNDLDEIEDIKDQLEATELKMLKSKELDWDEKQALKNSIEQTKKEIENLDKIAKAIESITEQAEKHKLLSPSLLEKFKELSELVSEIMPEEMMNNIEDLEMALEDMDIESLQDALNELSENMAQIEEDLDRYLEIFKRFQAEQKLDEIQNRMQKLNQQQNALNNEINKTDDNTTPMERLAQEEQRHLDE
jgi:chromosome segregation ATPase